MQEKYLIDDDMNVLNEYLQELQVIPDVNWAPKFDPATFDRDHKPLMV